MFFYVACFGFIGGIIFRSFVFSQITLAICIILVSFIFLIWEKRNICLVIFTLIISFGIGVLRYDIRDNDSTKTIFDSYVGENVVLEGIVITEPDTRENGINIVVKSQASILVNTALYSDIAYGDKVKLQGKILKPENFDGGNGNAFDYVAYLSKDDIYYQMKLPQITLIARHKGNPIKESLYGFKESFLKHLEIVLPSPHSALMGGLLLGTKQSLGKELQDDFRRAGIIHIIVLSGYNITIIADSIMKMFSFLPRNYGISFGIVSVILFALMTGGEATVVRATIMALIVILAKMTRRDYDVVRALCLAGIIMVIHNPKIVAFDSSFQLSFLATLGLIYISPIIEPKLRWVTDRFKIREILVTTVATQIAVLPLLLYKMGELSIVGVLVNLLVLGFIPVTMLLGFITGLLSFISVSLSWITGGFTYLLLWYEICVVEFFSNLPFATLTLSHFPLCLAISYYIAIIIYLWYKEKRLENKKIQHV